MTDDPRTIRVDEFLPHPPDKVSTVTFTLVPEGRGTRLFLVHDGFDPDDPYQSESRRFMGTGWPGVVRSIDGALDEARI